jgi:hypothetical protein
MNLLSIRFYLQWIINRNRTRVNPSTYSGLTLIGSFESIKSLRVDRLAEILPQELGAAKGVNLNLAS